MSETPRTTTEEWKWRRREAIIRDDYTCQECGVGGGPEGDAQLHVYHKTPVAEGGSNRLENLKTLCSDCHENRHAVRFAIGKKVTEDEIIETIKGIDGPFVTTSEVAEELPITRQAVYSRFETLHDDGDLGKKRLGSNSVGWWLKR